MFRDTRGSWSRREEKKTERKIDEGPVPLLLPVHDYITTTEECVFRIPSTARLAILHYYIPRRRSERSPWNLCVDIGYIGFWFVSLNIGSLFLLFLSNVCVYVPVCMETKDFFVLELSLRDFFCYRIIVFFFSFSSFEDLLWKIYSKSFLFFCLRGNWIFLFV